MNFSLPSGKIPSSSSSSNVDFSNVDNVVDNVVTSETDDLTSDVPTSSSASSKNSTACPNASKSSTSAAEPLESSVEPPLEPSSEPPEPDPPTSLDPVYRSICSHFLKRDQSFLTDENIGSEQNSADPKLLRKPINSVDLKQNVRQHALKEHKRLSPHDKDVASQVEQLNPLIWDDLTAAAVGVVSVCLFHCRESQERICLYHCPPLSNGSSAVCSSNIPPNIIPNIRVSSILEACGVDDALVNGDCFISRLKGTQSQFRVDFTEAELLSDSYWMLSANMWRRKGGRVGCYILGPTLSKKICMFVRETHSLTLLTPLKLLLRKPLHFSRPLKPHSDTPKTYPVKRSRCKTP